MARGFLLGATAGRTTLNGEGLQHEDGHSLLHRGDQPGRGGLRPGVRASRSAHIVEDGLRRMYGENPENIFYYLTVYNEPILQPAEPDDVDVEGMLEGIYRYAAAPEGDGPQGADPRLRRRQCRGRSRRSSCSPRTGACPPTSGR